MASPATPLLWGEPEINLTTLNTPPNFSRHIASLARPATPHTTLHEFRTFQSSPFLSPSHDLEHKRIRRKPSHLNLSGRLFASSTSSAAAPRTPPLLHREAEHHRAPSPLPHVTRRIPSREQPESPSLSSTVDTIQSSPTHSPSPDVDVSLDVQSLADEPHSAGGLIRSKRKFPTFKPAKRLPLRGGDGGGDWLVYAAVIDGGDACLHFDDRDAFDHVTGAENGVVWQASEPKGRDSGAKRGRSVRFAVVEAESASGTSTQEALETTGQERNANSDSTFTLSKFQFPPPPGQHWHGHPAVPTPPTSPTTLHYRGASFDVVNPHHSLLLGTKDFETPAEIDGLLDDYFDRSSPHTPSNKENDMASSQAARAQSDSGGRRLRTLYGDADSARREIMRLPSASSGVPNAVNNFHQESPLASRSLVMDQMMTFESESSDEDTGIAAIEVEGETVVRAARSSSVYPHSDFSDPFDLHVSEDEVERPLDNIDAVMTAPASTSVGDAELEGNRDERMVAEYDEGASAQATTSQQDTDSTLGQIVRQYDYTDMFTDDEDSGDSEDTMILSDPESPEHGRGGASSPAPQTSSMTYHFGLTHAYQYTETNGVGHGSFYRLGDPEGPLLSGRLSGPPDVPAPPQPLFAGTSRQLFGPILPAEYSDVPTTEQTYGQTGDLLQITPRQLEAPRPQNPNPDDQNSIASLGQASCYDHADDTENIPPVAHCGILLEWPDVDLAPGRRTSRDGHSFSEHLLNRSSSHYLEDDADWEDTLESESRVNSGYGANRVSTVSYADTSEDGSDHRMSVTGSQGQPSMHDVPNLDGSGTTRQFANKAHRVLMDGPNSPRQSPPTPSTDSAGQRAKELLLEKLRSDHRTSVQGADFGSTSPADDVRKRQNAAELERLRQTNPHAVRWATVQARTEFETSRIWSPSRPSRVYRPRNSYDRVVDFAMGIRGDGQSVSSETQGLLRASGSTHGRDGLQDADTIGTLPKTPNRAPPVPSIPDHAVQSWTPLPPRTVVTPRCGGNVTPSSSIRTGHANEYEMNALTRMGRARPAVLGQTSLRPITIGESATGATTSSPRRPLTDRELFLAEPGWSMYVTDSAQRRQRLRCQLPVHAPRLLSVEEGRRNPRVVEEQKRLSAGYFARCILFPPLALAFGMGWLDYLIEKKTNGRVKEMRPRDKSFALSVAAPLGVIWYACGGCVIAIFVLMGNGSI